ncbi:MAG: hypothetical protein NC313_12325 [Butyrivibrio sp.]|nr:hypothetical protein [Butyrivibrio sp.]
MATSSIFANVKITDPQKAEVFAEALDQSAREPKRMPSAPVIPLVTNIEDIRKFMTVRTGKDESVYNC